MKILSSRRHPQVYGREGRKETYCRRLSIRTRSHHMILMTIKASLFSLFQQPEQKKEQLKPGMGFHGVCDWCSILFRKNKHMLCYNRVHRRPRKQVRVRRPFEASDSRAPVVTSNTTHEKPAATTTVSAMSHCHIHRLSKVGMR